MITKLTTKTWRALTDYLRHDHFWGMFANYQIDRYKEKENGRYRLLHFRNADSEPELTLLAQSVILSKRQLWCIFHSLQREQEILTTYHPTGLDEMLQRMDSEKGETPDGGE